MHRPTTMLSRRCRGHVHCAWRHGLSLQTYAPTHSRPSPVTLSTLLSFARPLTAESVLQSSFYAQSELPKRLAARLRALEALPFIVGTNPHIAKMLNAF